MRYGIFSLVGTAIATVIGAGGTGIITADSVNTRTLWLTSTVAFNVRTDGAAATANSMLIPANTPMLLAIPAGAAVNMFSTAGGTVIAQNITISS
jgi:hypothetical protein